MILEIYLTSIIAFFVLAFAAKNIWLVVTTKQAIKGKSLKLTLSVLFSTIIYISLLLRIWGYNPIWFVELSHSSFPIIGSCVVTMGFVLGLWALYGLKDSWRVGIRYEQVTKLVTTGVYAFSRNPYFLSYRILILGYLLVFPSVLLLGLYLALIAIFHLMIKEEEKYLEATHGEEYRDYCKKVSRYFWIIN